MPASINLLFGVHMHQPVGNLEDVFKKAAQDCYRPFIETLYNYREIKSTLHISGSLIDWLLKNEVELLEKVKEMVGRRQIEILSGAYYEPILPIIPERDRIGQIKMLSNFVKDYFEYEPKGCWVGERVWEPHTVKSLTEAGIKYILLDDFHFRHSGMKEEDLFGYYLAEEEGRTLATFPISKRLRYSIPFSAPSQVLAYLKSLASEDISKVATIVDDGEKFGFWPGTHTWVYRQKWLENFFCLLIENQDWLKLQTISEYMQRHSPKGLCSLRCASYEEMMSWSGGFFRNFFIKYPEVNNLHKRMLYVSEMLNKQKRKNEEAKKYLYMGQCNCPYWHGVFGGIYLGHLRHAAYRNLIAAENLAKKKKSCVGVETFDFDKDGQDELIIRNPFLNVFISPHQGGGIFELDFIPKRTNLTNGMTRKPESYHENIKSKLRKSFRWRKKKASSIHSLLSSKEKGLENLLVYDSYRRISLLDHFFARNLSFNNFKNLRYVELGCFINKQYSVECKKKEKNLSVLLQRDGWVVDKGKKIPLTITKKLFLNSKSPELFIDYKLENLSKKPLDVIFAVEFNISSESKERPNNLYCKEGPKIKDYSLDSEVKVKKTDKLGLQDIISGIETGFHFDKKCDLWTHALETVSASEKGFERNYQQTVILPHWRVNLNKDWQLKLTLRVKSLS